jgi:hypothetical protein
MTDDQRYEDIYEDARDYDPYTPVMRVRDSSSATESTSPR